jgi:hypothetical protein
MASSLVIQSRCVKNVAVIQPQPEGVRKKEVYCVNRKATTSIAIKPTINNDAIVTAILFALGLSFHDLRP